MIGWVDDAGNLVDDVPDRFQAQYMFVDERIGKTFVSGCTLAEKGLATTSIRDVVTFGFSTDEWLDILEWEKRNGTYIQSEDELNDLFALEIRDLPSP
ncbi:hypothetical protein [Neorhizobium sp. P12A]|uniref:hypothetical protein n=1 Tax=Neorhizobium sp. P12A TaxID=2268027 RepID=UPI0011EC16E2|nr:hypothetical protein [Neorhizobium sp. P12A]